MTSHTESLPGAATFRVILVVLTVLLWGLMIVCAAFAIKGAWSGDIGDARGLAVGWGVAIVYTLWDMAKYIRRQVREIRA